MAQLSIMNMLSNGAIKEAVEAFRVPVTKHRPLLELEAERRGSFGARYNLFGIIVYWGPVAKLMQLCLAMAALHDSGRVHMLS